MSGIRIKTRLRDDVAQVRSIIRHPMETGFRVNRETAEVIPAHYIQLVSITHNEKIVMECDWSRAVSKNPYLSFEFSGAKTGDSLSLTWVDNFGETETTSVTI